MAITVAGKSGTIYSFEGPYASTNSLKDNSGVYAIHDKRSNGSYYLVDVGEASEVKKRIDTHDRKDCWERKKQGTLTCSVFYTPNKQQEGRKEVEQDIRKNYSNLCGDR